MYFGWRSHKIILQLPSLSVFLHFHQRSWSYLQSISQWIITLGTYKQLVSELSHWVAGGNTKGLFVQRTPNQNCLKQSLRLQIVTRCWQLAFKNSVSRYILTLVSRLSKVFSIAAYPVWLCTAYIQIKRALNGGKAASGSLKPWLKQIM